jgi:hypothetical protein
MALGLLRRGSIALRDPGRVGTILYAVAAVLCSAALAVWAFSGQRNEAAVASATLRPPLPAAFAAVDPDPEQARRAYQGLQEIYANRGMSGVIEFAKSCPDFVTAAPSQLDFCLAFLIDAAALASRSPSESARRWSEGAAAEQLALARRAVPPGVDPKARVATVQQFTRVLVRPVAASPMAPTAPPATAAQANQPRLLRTGAEPSPRARAPQAGRPLCHARATPTVHALCADQRVRAQDDRLRLAYRRALARSPHPVRLERQQVRWEARVQAAAPNAKLVARLYRVRLQELTPKPAKPRRTHTPKLWQADVPAGLAVPPH